MEFEITYESEHWNGNYGCMIPEVWSAVCTRDDNKIVGIGTKRPCGDTREKAIANIRREFPDAVIS